MAALSYRLGLEDIRSLCPERTKVSKRVNSFLFHWKWDDEDKCSTYCLHFGGTQPIQPGIATRSVKVTELIEWSFGLGVWIQVVPFSLHEERLGLSVFAIKRRGVALLWGLSSDLLSYFAPFAGKDYQVQGLR